MANTVGVFTLDELLALGQTGDARKDWLAGGPGRAALDPKLKFPAGYYSVGQNQAIYVDPKSGSVPQQFMDMLDPTTGDLKRDSITGVPSAYLPDNKVWQQPSYYTDMQNAMEQQRQLEATGLTAQQAQDQRLGGRPVVGASDTYKPGVHNSVGSSQGAYAKFIALGGTDDLLGAPVNPQLDPNRITTLKDSLAENFMQRAGAQEGLRGLRTTQGLDPATGTSQAEMQRLQDTYNALDPAKRSQWLFYQDPGNLTPELRDLRSQARQGERDLIANANQYDPYYEHINQGGKSYEFVIKKGDVTQTDSLGREKFFGGVPLKAEFVKGKYDRVGDFGRRFGGGLSGAFLGFFGSGGNPLGAAMGAYQGAGGPAPTGGVAGGLWGAASGAVMGGGLGAVMGGYQGAGGVKGLKSGGFNNWQGSGGSIPGARELGSAVFFAKMGAKTPGAAWGQLRA